MTRVRAAVALAVVVTVVAAAMVGIGWSKHDRARAIEAKRNAALLVSSDFRPGYSRDSVESEAFRSIGGTPTPSCRAVIADQDSRKKGQITTSAIFTSASDGPTYTQAVASGGESVADSRSVIRQCPRYTRTAGSQSASFDTGVFTFSPGCPDGALIVSQTFQSASLGTGTPITTLQGYLQGRALTTVLAQSIEPGVPGPPAEFCRLLTTASKRLAAAER